MAPDFAVDVGDAFLPGVLGMQTGWANVARLVSGYGWASAVTNEPRAASVMGTGWHDARSSGEPAE